MRQAVPLLDASIYVFKAYFALPDAWRSRSGMPTNAVVGFAGVLASLLEREPEGLFFTAFDESLGTCFRHAIHPGYKQSRALPDEQLAFQLSSCRELAETLGMSCAASSLFEADDLLASAAAHARHAGYRCAVLSRDKDLGQLLAADEDILWDFPAGEPADRATWTARQGIRPEQLPARLALTGDPVDDIPGVPGIGERTANSLLSDHEDIEDILDDLAGIARSGRRGAARIVSALEAGAGQLRMARRLTALAPDAIPLPPPFGRSPVDADRLDALSADLGFGNQLRRRLGRLAGSMR